jgi:two-component system OmpR family sensor kinase
VKIQRLPYVRIRPWGQWTLRIRLMVAIAALSAVGLVVADFAGMVLLRSYLIGRVDDQLTAQANGLTRFPGVSDSNLYRSRGGGPLFGPDFRTYLFSANGDLVRAPTEASGPELGSFGGVQAHAGPKPYTVDGVDGPWRVKVTLVTSNAGQQYYVASAVSLKEIVATGNQLLVNDVLVTGLVLVLLALAAASVVRIGLRPLTRMEDIAAEIAGGDLSRRVTDADPHTESGRLGMALNTMLARIEEALQDRTASEQRLRQFLADASHELRTPLTSIQGFAELYRRGGARPGPELDEAMGRIEDEVGRMRLLVNDLLLLARLDEERPLERRPVDLLAVAADAVRDAHIRVPTRFVQLSGLDDSAATFEPVTVLGDEARIRQVVTNLVANAVQHTPDDTEVVVRVGRCRGGVGDTSGATARVGQAPDDQDVAIIEVVDTGPGMSPGDGRRAFERLYRADPSRVRRHGGAGLGLSIVAAIVQAHGGQVELWTALGEGSRFRVLLPAEPPFVEEPEDGDADQFDAIQIGRSG